MKLPSFRQERLIGKSPWAVHWRTAVPPRRTSSFFERTLKWTGAGKEKDHVHYLSSVAVHKLDYSRWIIPYRFWGQFFSIFFTLKHYFKGCSNLWVLDWNLQDLNSNECHKILHHRYENSSEQFIRQGWFGMVGKQWHELRSRRSAQLSVVENKR